MIFQYANEEQLLLRINQKTAYLKVHWEIEIIAIATGGFHFTLVGLLLFSMRNFLRAVQFNV
jgi:hypothetical protein